MDRQAKVLYFNHPKLCAGRTQMIPLDVFEDIHYRLGRGHGPTQPVLQVEHMNFTEQRIRSTAPVLTQRLVDMEPTFMQEVEHFDPRTIFQSLDSGLLVPVDTVPDLLARIIELQEPARQDRLQEEVRRRARDVDTKLTSAKIVQFRAA